jgi:hypothetical protein
MSLHWLVRVAQPSAMTLEQLTPALCLGVGRVLDLVLDGFRPIGVGLPLRHDTLEIQPAGGLEQFAPLLLEAW